jgi:hypothetical protein
LDWKIGENTKGNERNTKREWKGDEPVGQIAIFGWMPFGKGSKEVGHKVGHVLPPIIICNVESIWHEFHHSDKIPWQLERGNWPI